MEALLLIAHGSRRQASNEEVKDLKNLLSLSSNNTCRITEHAFLELARPSIPEGISACVTQGASRIIALPYFLSAGRHVTDDIPSELEIAKKLHPNINIKIAPYLGKAEAISDILLELSKQYK